MDLRLCIAAILLRTALTMNLDYFGVCDTANRSVEFYQNRTCNTTERLFITVRVGDTVQHHLQTFLNTSTYPLNNVSWDGLQTSNTNWTMEDIFNLQSLLTEEIQSKSKFDQTTAITLTYAWKPLFGDMCRLICINDTLISKSCKTRFMFWTAPDWIGQEIVSLIQNYTAETVNYTMRFRLIELAENITKSCGNNTAIIENYWVNMTQIPQLGAPCNTTNRTMSLSLPYPKSERKYHPFVMESEPLGGEKIFFICSIVLLVLVICISIFMFRKDFKEFTNNCMTRRS